MNGAATSLTAEHAEDAENDNLWIYDNRERSAVSKAAPCSAFLAYSAVKETQMDADER